MMDRKYGSGDLSALPMGLVLGAGGSMVITLLLTGLFTFLMDLGKIGEGALGICAVTILVLSSAFGSAVAFRKVRNRRLVVCMGTGVVYYLVLLACTALLFDGMYQGLGVTALAIGGGAGAVVLVGLREGGKRNGGRVGKYRHSKLVQNRQRGN